MGAKGYGAYSQESLDVAEVATNNRTAGDMVDNADGKGSHLWLTTTASGETGTIRVRGSVLGDCATGTAFAAGDVCWITSGGVFTTVSTANTPAGYVQEDKAAGPGLTTVKVYLSPGLAG